MRDEHPLVAAYRAFSPGSEKLAARAQAVFPGGDTRSSAHYGPYPLVISEAQGCRLTDVDGNELLDFMNNFTSLILGHGNRAVVEAVGARSRGHASRRTPRSRWSTAGSRCCPPCAGRISSSPPPAAGGGRARSAS